jgi:hypothetical protein
MSRESVGVLNTDTIEATGMDALSSKHPVGGKVLDRQKGTWADGAGSIYSDLQRRGYGS